MDETAHRAQQAARALGIDTPYTVRVVGGRLELHTPWKIYQEFAPGPDPEDLARMSKAELRNLARQINAQVAGRATKADLAAAIKDLLP
ncbi:MAG: hypothetical protein JW781_02660 [Deltaproteobacteria bacterium]|nr:hypothetical protein [Candidatus Anaeroferrophillacea bacterium]